jgi:murein L,D-transpeptidase YafK
MKQSYWFIGMLICFVFSISSNLLAQNSFVTSQKGFTKSIGFNKLEDTLKQQFKSKELSWPPQSVYIRSFKYDRIMELWVKNINTDTFTLFKTYKVCMQSGSLGPKRSEGDKQVPEGFYYINEFNSKSNYHLALGLNYPNAADKVLSDVKNPGGDIYIHGNCVSTGCIAIQDLPIEEVFTIASLAKSNGQDFIPVHIYPVYYSIKKSSEYLASSNKNKQLDVNAGLSLKAVFDSFEKNKKLPVIIVNKKGEYSIN